eukprot:7998497-Pyramimonas_sp.AAC.1
MSSSARSEVTRRISAGRVSFHSLGAVWSIPFPFKWKRALLLGFGQGPPPQRPRVLRPVPGGLC